MKYSVIKLTDIHDEGVKVHTFKGWLSWFQATYVAAYFNEQRDGFLYGVVRG